MLPYSRIRVHNCTRYLRALCFLTIGYFVLVSSKVASQSLCRSREHPEPVTTAIAGAIVTPDQPISEGSSLDVLDDGFTPSSIRLSDYCRWKARVLGRSDLPVGVLRSLSLKRRIYVGASGKYLAGWESFDRSALDVTKEQDYANLFCRGEIHAFLSEHTFEHISHEGMMTAFQLFFDFLSEDGYVRTAIPAYPPHHNPDENDRKIGHVNFPTADDLVHLMEQIGYRDVQKLEWYDFATKTFHTTSWDVCEGTVIRSVQYDRRNQDFLRNNYHRMNLTYSEDGSTKSSSLSRNVFPANEVAIKSTIVQGFKRARQKLQQL